jgi:glycosyltransferase involved in cell wall biosynthesis
LHALVEQLGLQDQVRFYGRVPHHEIPVLLRNHDGYVQPSVKHSETLQEEGQPIALLEAIATGMPVIVTDTGAMAETVRVGPYAGNAFVIPDKDEDAIAEALGAVMRTPRTEHTGREYVRAIFEKHSQEGQIGRTLRVYERAWSGP